MPLKPDVLPMVQSLMCLWSNEASAVSGASERLFGRRRAHFFQDGVDGVWPEGVHVPDEIVSDGGEVRLHARQFAFRHEAERRDDVLDW
eukprot:5305116-Pleurochrysis_carterae.AAC.1